MARKNIDRKVRELNKDFSMTSTEGKIRENLAIVKLLKEGYGVLLPVVDVRYDIIAERYPKFMRIQVKNLKLEYKKVPEQPLSIDQFVIRAFSSPRGEKTTYSKDDTDFVMGINIDTEDFAIIPVENIPSSGVIKISEKCDRKDYFNSFKALVEFELNTSER
ncbi:group I intron-associated PD-(D/E)XK endonuclease [Brassicibacter mesophilus]|uniref:group I intron-associated PD-(D/E)XK endonuclease n=1 Tax=Brassicibacter mesophilus TaxID=745119 RepID=UPI003D1A3859